MPAAPFRRREMKMGGHAAAQVLNATREEPRNGSATRPARVTEFYIRYSATPASIRQFYFMRLSQAGSPDVYGPRRVASIGLLQEPASAIGRRSQPSMSVGACASPAPETV
jgi:hypothetical protein